MFAIIAQLVAVYLVALVAYRVWFHPLRRFKGPWIAKVTDLYSVFYCLKGNRHISLFELHQAYGPFVRIGPNRLSISTPTALKEIYAVTANVQKSQVYSTYQYFFEVPMSMTTIDRSRHAVKRRINVKSIRENVFVEMQEPMRKNIEIFCELLGADADRDGWSPARNMSKAVAYLTSDIMGDFVFSRNWNVQKSTENRDIVDTVLPQGVAGVNLTGHAPYILKLQLHKVFFSSLVNSVFRFKKLTQDQAEWRMAQQEKKQKTDILATLLESSDPETGERLPTEEIISEAGLLIIAGSDTMGTTIVATLYYLMKHPKMLERLEAEILSTFSSYDDIRMGPLLNSCKYLYACLTETMRISPPVAALLPREVCSGGMTIDGEFVPQGTDVGVPIYGLQHDPTYYPKPFEYKPDRWIKEAEGTSAESLAAAQSAWHPFGVGRTSCIGKTFAYVEMSLIIAHLIWTFELRTAEPPRAQTKSPTFYAQEGLFPTRDIFTSEHTGPFLSLKRRVR